MRRKASNRHRPAEDSTRADYMCCLQARRLFEEIHRVHVRSKYLHLVECQCMWLTGTLSRYWHKHTFGTAERTKSNRQPMYPIVHTGVYCPLSVAQKIRQGQAFACGPLLHGIDRTVQATVPPPAAPKDTRTNTRVIAHVTVLVRVEKVHGRVELFIG